MTAVVMVLGEALILMLLGAFIGGFAVFIEAIGAHHRRRAISSLGVSVASILAFIGLILLSPII